MPVKVGVNGAVKSVSSMPVSVNGVIKNTNFGYVGLNGTVTRFFPYAAKPIRLEMRTYQVLKATMTSSSATFTTSSTTLGASTSLGSLSASSSTYQMTILPGSANISSGLLVYYKAYVVYDDNTEVELSSFIKNGGKISIRVVASESYSTSSQTYWQYWTYFYGAINAVHGTYNLTQDDLKTSNIGEIGKAHSYNYSTGTLYETQTFSNCVIDGVSVSILCKNTIS